MYWVYGYLPNTNYKLYIYYIILVNIIMAIFKYYIREVWFSKVKNAFQITQLISCRIKIQVLIPKSMLLFLYSSVPQKERWTILKGKLQKVTTKQVALHPELFYQSFADSVRLCLFFRILYIYRMSMSLCL